MRVRRRLRRDRGAVAVEMALVTPLLVALVFGIIDFGRIFNAEIQLSQAAREGARIAALGEPTYTQAAAEKRARDAHALGIGAVVATATMCSPNPTPADDGIVTVTYAFTGILFPTKNLTQEARMKCVTAS